mgnify:CR=1 FL=1
MQRLGSRQELLVSRDRLLYRYRKSDAAVVVKHLAYAVYDGQLSAQQAYAKAFRSGVPHEQLYQAFNDLSDGVNQ